MLGRVLAMEWKYGVNLLEAAICVTGSFLRMWEGAILPVHTSKVLG